MFPFLLSKLLCVIKKKKKIYIHKEITALLGAGSEVPWHATLWMLYRCQWAPNTVLEDVPEIQPWCRITATTSQSNNELSTNVPFVEAGQGGVWGCGPEQLEATDLCASVYSGCM